MASLEQRVQEIELLVDGFCAAAFDGEFKSICRIALDRLAQKTRFMLLRGRPEQWAAALVYAVATVNGCFAKNSPYLVKVDDICNYFAVKRADFVFKTAEIRSVLRMTPYNIDFLLEINQKNNPEFDTVILDGKKVPLDSLPEEARLFIRNRRADGWDVVLVS